MTGELCKASELKLFSLLELNVGNFCCSCRIGYHYTVTHITSFPLLLLRSLARTHGSDRAAVESDIADNLYGSAVYIIIMVRCSAFGSFDT